MKKLIMMLTMFMVTVAANAQFEEGTKYIGASLTNVGLSYNGADKLNLGIQAKVGYFVQDGWQINALAGFEHHNPSFNALTVGAGLRYYIVDNGFFVGAGAKCVFANARNDIMPGIELGYAFYISESLAIEPAVYYDQSFHSHSDYSTVGIKIGLGYFF